MQRNLQTVNQAVGNYPFLTHGGLRHQIFNEDKNGLRDSGVILRAGRKVLIDMDRYFQWLDRINGVSASEEQNNKEQVAA